MNKAREKRGPKKTGSYLCSWLVPYLLVLYRPQFWYDLRMRGFLVPGNICGTLPGSLALLHAFIERMLLAKYNIQVRAPRTTWRGGGDVRCKPCLSLCSNLMLYYLANIRLALGLFVPGPVGLHLIV